MGGNSINAIVIPHGIQEHYSVGFANALAGRGVGVEFISSENIDPELLNKSVHWYDLGQNKQEGLPGLEKARRFLAYHLKLIGFVLKRRQRVVHVIGTFRYEVLMGVVEGLLFRLLGHRYYLTVHNIVPHDSGRSCRSLVYKMIYGIPHGLVVHTEKMRSDLINECAIEPEKITLMHHGLNDAVPDISHEQRECRESMGIPEDMPTLLFFGNIAPYKGLDILLEALTDIGNVSLIIAGKPKSSEYRKEIEGLIEKHPQKDNIYSNLGWIENEVIPQYMCAADALVMPYRHIDQSGVLFLAMRYGLPVIASDVGSIREYVPEFAGMIIRDNSDAGLSQAIREFVNIRDTFNREAIQDHANSFSWSNVVAPVIELYESE